MSENIINDARRLNRAELFTFDNFVKWYFLRVHESLISACKSNGIMQKQDMCNIINKWDMLNYDI